MWQEISLTLIKMEIVSFPIRSNRTDKVVHLFAFQEGSVGGLASFTDRTTRWFVIYPFLLKSNFAIFYQQLYTASLLWQY